MDRWVRHYEQATKVNRRAALKEFGVWEQIVTSNEGELARMPAMALKEGALCAGAKFAMRSSDDRLLFMPSIGMGTWMHHIDTAVLCPLRAGGSEATVMTTTAGSLGGGGARPVEGGRSAGSSVVQRQIRRWTSGGSRSTAKEKRW